ncbi:putative calcium-binding protein CML17 [Platanthera guangdongensis]|uniref:Calcium-binding protein CML17 n=1 Tax=Platanthera guangdongensis TaxID=2320717 RepID=A0ABR2M3A2_9ASPA
MPVGKKLTAEKRVTSSKDARVYVVSASSYAEQTTPAASLPAPLETEPHRSSRRKSDRPSPRGAQIALLLGGWHCPLGGRTTHQEAGEALAVRPKGVGDHCERARDGGGKEDNMREAFNLFDRNGNGFITVDELG